MSSSQPEHTPEAIVSGRRRAQRSDAKRNRQQVIDTAFEVFAAEGLSAPVHEIARRAGVGTGTVSRHFPTKESLFEAVFLSRVERLSVIAHDLLAATDHGEAFFTFFTEVIAEGAANRGLAEALAGAGFDLDAIASGDNDIMKLMRQLLAAAQTEGTLRADATVADAKALLGACLQQTGQDQERMLSIVRAGMSASHHPPT